MASASPEAEASPQSTPATSAPAPAPSATATARATAGSSVLPRRVVAGYWQAWGHPSVRLRDVPRDYDLVMVSFATGDSDGTLRFSQSVQSPASFAADVRALRATDRRVLLSVGGWRDGGLEIRSAAQLRVFLRSVSAIIDAHHFQGLDWDLEHGIDPARVAQATRWLKARYGPDFLITMAPVLDPGPEREQLDLAMRIRGVLDMVSLQFYNTGHGDTGWIVDRALLWA
ncbi:MAG TPA: glycosyl hydrolase family 18 protein, partial [Pedococcus sp.]|nr:glycosyl hydrolase family 18 protein [Pedococcus sp.]